MLTFFASVIYAYYRLYYCTFQLRYLCTVHLYIYFTFTSFPNVYLISGKEPLIINILLSVSIALVKAGGGGILGRKCNCACGRVELLISPYAIQSSSESLCTVGIKFRMSLFFIGAVLVVFLRCWRKICTILQLMGSKR
jgi:hypothetical protein